MRTVEILSVSESLKRRLIKRSVKNELTGCLEWSGAVSKDGGRGYGRIRVSRSTCLCTHRVAFVIENGEIPEGKLVLHSCDNPRCINPDHLFLGDQKQNMEDMTKKGRRNSPIGVRAHTARMNDAKVVDIRQMKESGKTNEQIAAVFGIGQSTVSAICNRRTWKHI